MHVTRLLIVAVLTAVGAGSQALLVFCLHRISPDATSWTALGVYLAEAFILAALLEYVLRIWMVSKGERAQFVLGALAGCAAHAAFRRESQDQVRNLAGESAIVRGAIVVAGILIAGALGVAASRRFASDRS